LPLAVEYRAARAISSEIDVMIGSLHERISTARDDLVRAGLTPDDAAFDAELLARHALGWDRATLFTRAAERPPIGFAERYADLVVRRATREPVALITGHREFWGLDFEVTRDVLIPRPETELIVECALEHGRGPNASGWIVDVGTGSGCIAVALATELRHANVLAIDTSRAALIVASQNAARHGVAGRVRCVRANLLDAVAGPVDLIVSNPPYVPVEDAATLQPEVARYEPPAALFADEHGLAIVRTLFETAAARLAAGGLLVVEFGFGQDERVRALADANGWSVVTLAPDLQGIPRVAVLTRQTSA
jgi:release factor glutamine methyltransferase